MALWYYHEPDQGCYLTRRLPCEDGSIISFCVADADAIASAAGSGSTLPMPMSMTMTMTMTDLEEKWDSPLAACRGGALEVRVVCVARIGLESTKHAFAVGHETGAGAQTWLLDSASGVARGRE